MKRLKLKDFKTKNLKQTNSNSIDQLLGQVLGDCHDSKSTTSSSLRKRPGRA